MSPPSRYVLALTPQETAIVRRALGTLPYDAVQGLIANIDGQVAQIQAAEAQPRTPPE